ncbi:BREX-1 system adenine-specific DNA-methyltransferase PglX [Micrococcus luteus]|nr:BREX-1 system adenine-specific DNA-methyltransferase PglX [Micrococcus luteus]MCV7632934.1 BREX-1 system adenine-specific DNA-methyltransferase PglX [Micrococcus luteus]
METAPLKSFATWARRELITQVSARLTAVLAPSSPERVENQRAVAMLERDIAAAGGGAKGKDAIADKVAYTWFNRIIALRFMDANGYTGIGVVSPAHGQQVGQPEILADAKRGSIDPAVITNNRTLDAITGLLDGTRPSADPQGEAYTLLLAEYCRYWNRSMPFMFEREGDYTELLIPANLLAADSILTQATAALTEEVCREVEVIGWLYQFYISERKQEVFDGFTKGKKAGAAEIPAATQLFTPHWIVRYLVENSVGRLWMLNHPASGLVDQMDYYIAPIDNEGDFLKVASPEELTVIDPACGSGHMLTYAFDLLYAIYEEEGYAPSEIPELILTHNLYGTEIDPRAGSLAAFALSMKARAKQRTFFTQHVEPNICVIDRVSFSADELDFLATKNGLREEEESFWQQFADAEALGSLIQPDESLTVVLTQHLERLDVGDDILKADTIYRARRALHQATSLLPRYAVVVANPPYMGSANLTSEARTALSANYKVARSDLYAMFVERALALTLRRGLVAMVTMQAWMFTTSYEPLRKLVLDENRLVTLAQLGRGAFESISGEVVSTAAYVLCRAVPGAATAGRYVRAVDGGPAEKAALIRGGEAITVRQDLLGEIPGYAMVYWEAEYLAAAFNAMRPLSAYATVREGIHTGNNATYLRYWWEVSRSRVVLDASEEADIDAQRGRWIPYNKGGTYARWYGHNYWVIAYDKASRLGMSGLPGHVRPSQSLYFKAGATWSDVGSAGLALKYFPHGYLFDGAGPVVIADGVPIELLVAGMNSKPFGHLAELLMPNLHYKSGTVQRVPFPRHEEETRAIELGKRAIHLVRADWDDNEVSFDFATNESVRSSDRRGALDQIITDVQIKVEATAEEVDQLETENDAIFGRAYGVDPTTIEFGRPSAISAPQASELVCDLVSYAVGCMFGRYSLDMPGLVLADQGVTLQDYLANVPQPTFAPDADNVLPIVDGEWFEDDVVARFRQFLRAAFGEEHFEENLRFVEESLGVKTLREYFITRAGKSKFYEDHWKRYKKRPIYWLFSSPKGSFNALIYMHRYTPSTVSTVLNEYLREFESKLEANLQHQERLAAGDGTPREKAAALKESERLRKVLLELSEYEHDVLYPLASQQIAIDLDDGVKVNYPRFYPALKKIPGLEAADE